MTTSTYWEAPALVALTAEINAAAPKRSKASDGWIGDKAHASRDSEHNPEDWPTSWTGVVRARDYTHDPKGGLDCSELAQDLVELMRGRKHPALGPGAYIIWAGRIISFNRLDEGWRPYPGTNPHTKHLHISVAAAAAGYNSKVRWGVLADDPADPVARPKRIARYLAESAIELERLKKARAAAIARGEGPAAYTAAIQALRESRRAAKTIGQR